MAHWIRLEQRKAHYRSHQLQALGFPVGFIYNWDGGPCTLAIRDGKGPQAQQIIDELDAAEQAVIEKWQRELLAPELQASTMSTERL